MTRIFLSAGESSGDLHGANLIRALREADPSVECLGLGGRRMEEAGMELLHDVAGTGIMGFVEVVKHFGFFKRLYVETVRRLEFEPPDCLVVIDYPGFNIQIAKRASLFGIPVVWYISPQVWAWKRGRVFTIARIVEKMLVILPFEERIYKAVGVDCAFVGHPLLDHIAATPVEGLYREGMIIGLLPGSREQEIGRLLGTMLEVARGIQGKYPEARFVVPCVDEARAAQVRTLAAGFPLETVIGKTYEVLDGARFCLVASGTATVEVTLFNVPMIILYRVAPVTYWLARMLVRVDHIGMVNILAKKRVVPEFVQHEATVKNMLPVALELIAEGELRTRMLEDLAAVREQLGGPGASRRAAEQILAVLGKEAHG
ncbi:MAG: lipid-A-disaccharide synthase [Candidatus Hydrogenedentes bacterium]|nr:lipid-A-disaccharide synthase [Candidatus Hydrogenedentota bacterium]